MAGSIDGMSLQKSGRWYKSRKNDIIRII